MQSEIIKKVHEIGHFAVGKTEEIVKRKFFISKLIEKIRPVLEIVLTIFWEVKRRTRKKV